MDKAFNHFILIVLIAMIVLTRSHGISFVHLPDFTLVALIIAGVYLRSSIAPFAIIISAVLVDNYAIVHQGVSANCITPAYTILLALYYGVYSVAKFIPSLAITSINTLIKIFSMVIVIISVEWLFATMSYYAFTTALWADFPSYALKWSVLEIPNLLYQVVIVSAFISGIKMMLSNQQKNSSRIV